MSAKRRPDAIDAAVTHLLAAARSREVASAEPWDYGWAFPDYRRSAKAAMSHSGTVAVRFSENGVEQFEKAAEGMLRHPVIKDRYDREEFWSILASAVATLPLDAPEPALEQAVRARAERLIDPPQSVVVFPVANCSCDLPVVVGNCLLGSAASGWVEQLEKAAGFKLTPTVAGGAWWAMGLDEGNDASDVVLFAWWGREQRQLARIRAEEAFNDLVSAALVLDLDPNARRLYSLRGDTNRPGVRGLQVDRTTLEDAARSTRILQSELGAEVLIAGVFPPSISHHWYSADVFPLCTLIAEAPSHKAIERVMSPSNSVDHRLRTAARWHSKQHWASAIEDAILALGIAFDALLSESGPSPGRVLGERFALLSKTKVERPQAYRHFMQDIYSARSTVAHGGRSSKHGADFVREVSAELRGVFRAIEEVTAAEGVKSEDDYAKLFEHLKWDIPYPRAV
jgi:Apea-like HEPN